MADGAGSFNQNATLQVLSADSPEKLASLIRQVRVPLQIVSFTASGGKHICYFRCNWKVKVKGKKPQTTYRVLEALDE